MDLGIGGRSALVFGGSRGIGRAVANVLAAEGANVAVCARKGWAARRVAAEAAERGRVKALGYALEAWDETSAAAQAERIARDFGAIDILFGIVRHTLREDGQSNPGAPTWSARLDDGFLRFRALTEALLPGMRRRRWGRVLWMVPWPEARNSAEESVRAATGAAFTAWLRCVAAEVARDGVTLNVLTPPPFWRRAAPAGRVRPESVPAPGGAGAPLAGADPEDRDPPLACEVLSAGEIAAAAAFLLSDCARGVCGRTLELGATMAPSRHPNVPRRRDGTPRQ
ncbi:MAG: SDR family NAD(P)-dependent oxidoreductase [Deltaproteobacteria bacterium]|nr:SDR family NAD(P)-dependent oxidoreductase [Deltaproteobacteria bacterium]